MPQPTPPFLLSLHSTRLPLLLLLFPPPLELALLSGGENPAFSLPAALVFAGTQSFNLLSFFTFVLFEGRVQTEE